MQGREFNIAEDEMEGERGMREGWGEGRREGSREGRRKAGVYYSRG